jgi:hypothetical protein
VKFLDVPAIAMMTMNDYAVHYRSSHIGIKQLDGEMAELRIRTKYLLDDIKLMHSGTAVSRQVTTVVELVCKLYPVKLADVPAKLPW